MSRLLRNQLIGVIISLIGVVLVAISCVPAAQQSTFAMTPAPSVTSLASTQPPITPSIPTKPVQPTHPASVPQKGSPGSSNHQTVWLYNPSGVRGDGIYVDWQLKQTMEQAGIEKPPLAGESNIRIEIILTNDPYSAATKLFYQRGWTDGLPIVPPTEEAVANMLTGTDLPRDQVVATLDPMGGQATVEKIAVNAVMAGCSPEYMPVLITAVEAIADPVFDLAGVGTTTNPNASMIIVNGPIAKQLDINSGANALGRGWTANATIGRALHLIEQNIGGSWPGVSDVSSLGSPGDFSMMLAENEPANPWQPLQVELGFTKEQNVVTVLSAEGMQRVLDIGVNGEGFLGRVANYVSARESTNKNLLLILTPFTAEKLTKEGWNKDSIRNYINTHARVPLFRYKSDFMGTSDATTAGTPISPTAGPTAQSTLVIPTADPNGMVQVPFINHLTILVAGGVGEKDELIPMWSTTVSREIKLPANWNEILANASK